MQKPNTIVNDNVNYFQDRLRLSNDALATDVGVSVKTISRWKNGKEIKKKYYEKLAEAFRIDTKILTSDQPNEEPNELYREHNEDFTRFTCKVSRHSDIGFALIKSRFGISKSNVVEWAPALFYLVASHAVHDLQKWVDMYNEQIANAQERFVPDEEYYLDYVNKLEMLKARDVFGKLFGRTCDEARIPFIEAFIKLSKNQPNELSPKYLGDTSLEGHLPAAVVLNDLETCKKLARGDEALASAIQDGNVYFPNIDESDECYHKLKTSFSKLCVEARGFIRTKRKEYHERKKIYDDYVSKNGEEPSFFDSASMSYVFKPKSLWLIELWRELDDVYGEWKDA